MYAIADGKNWQFAQKPSFDLLFYLNSSRGFPKTNSTSFQPNISKLASLNSKQMLFCMFFFDLNTQIPANSADYISKWISLLKKNALTQGQECEQFKLPLPPMVTLEADWSTLLHFA